MTQITDVDQALRKAADAREVPGVVAMAATDSEIDLSGRVRPARPRQAAIDDARHRVLDRLDDQGDHRRRRDAAGRAGQARRSTSRSARSLPELAAMQVLEGFDAERQAEAARRASGRSRCAICSPTRRASATTSGTPTWASTWRRRGIPGITTCENKALTTPLLVRSGRALGIRHQHRLGRQGGRGRRAASSSMPI